MSNDPRPLWKQFLPGRPSMIGRIRMADDLLYFTIPKARQDAPEAVPCLEAAMTAMRLEAERIYSASQESRHKDEAR